MPEAIFPLVPSSPLIIFTAIAVAGIVGLLSSVVPSCHASRMDIVEGLRYIG